MRMAHVASRDDHWMRAGLALTVAGLVVGLVLPLVSLFWLVMQDRDGAFVGLANLARYLSTPQLATSAVNSVLIAVLTVVIVVPIAFVYAYALTRARLPLRGLFHAVAAVPLLAPSVLPALALIYLFGNQGFLRFLLPAGEGIYGLGGIVAAQVFYTFPHALVLIATGLAAADARLYEAATALRTPAWRVFWTITLPGARYGVVSAIVVVFTEVVTDFGIAKIIGGQVPVLATDVYKQVVGQQNFPMGATIGLVLLLPAVAAFWVDRWVQRRQVALITARAVPYHPPVNPTRDAVLFGISALVALTILAVLGMAAWASVIQYWPYNLAFTWRHYHFEEVDAAGWSSVGNTLELALWSATIGTPITFLAAWLADRARVARGAATAVRAMAMVPLAVPGLVLGIGFIFFFNAPWNPLNFLYGTMALLVLNTIVRQFPVSFLTATTALKGIDREFEQVSASLKVPVSRTLVRVIVPLSAQTLVNIWMFFFLYAATTLSAIIFLYVPDTKTAAIAIIHLEETGATASAAAMAMVIVALCLAVKLLALVVSAWIDGTTSAWSRQGREGTG